MILSKLQASNQCFIEDIRSVRGADYLTSPSGLKRRVRPAAASNVPLGLPGRPDVASSSLLAPTLSISSMNTIEGPLTGKVQTAPSPIAHPLQCYFWTSSEPTNLMNVAVSLLRHRGPSAEQVFPVLGSHQEHSLGRVNADLFVEVRPQQWSSTASRTSSIALKSSDVVIYSVSGFEIISAPTTIGSRDGEARPITANVCLFSAT